MRYRINEMKKKTKLKEKIEERKDLIIVKLQKEEDTSVKILVEEMSATYTC